MKTIFDLRQLTVGLTSLALLLGSATVTQANVYATNVRINGSATDAALYIPCGSVQISYVLNEPASGGVTIDVVDGTSVVHSIVFPADAPGALRGLNTYTWDGKNSQGNLVPLATYAVRITAAAKGYSQWTQINDEFSYGSYAWYPTSIAVNRNPNSPYYGRILVANALPGPNPGYSPSDRVGILKLNADGSYASDGASSGGGWPWAGDGFSPWKIEISPGDEVFVQDGTSNVVLSFDQTISPESRKLVLRGDNLPAGSAFNGLFLTGRGNETCLWMADANEAGSLGLRLWSLGDDGIAAPNDAGVTMVQAGSEADLNPAPYDLALDASNRVYAIQRRVLSGDPAPRLLGYPPYTNSILPLTNATWMVGNGDNSMRGAAGVAVDPAGTYAAVAFQGGAAGGGHTTVFSLASGQGITNFFTNPGGEAHLDVAWDNVGNLYDVDNAGGIWRAYSPPGSNAAVTVALAPLRVTQPPLAPILAALGHAHGEFTLALTGRTNVDYVIQASPDFQMWTPVATNRDDVCATRVVVVKGTAERSFYRATPAITISP